MEGLTGVDSICDRSLCLKRLVHLLRKLLVVLGDIAWDRLGDLEEPRKIGRY